MKLRNGERPLYRADRVSPNPKRDRNIGAGRTSVIGRRNPAPRFYTIPPVPAIAIGD